MVKFAFLIEHTSYVWQEHFFYFLHYIITFYDCWVLCFIELNANEYSKYSIKKKVISFNSDLKFENSENKVSGPPPFLVVRSLKTSFHSFPKERTCSTKSVKGVHIVAITVDD